MIPISFELKELHVFALSERRHNKNSLISRLLCVPLTTDRRLALIVRGDESLYHQPGPLKHGASQLCHWWNRGLKAGLLERFGHIGLLGGGGLLLHRRGFLGRSSCGLGLGDGSGFGGQGLRGGDLGCSGLRGGGVLGGRRLGLRRAGAGLRLHRLI